MNYKTAQLLEKLADKLGTTSQYLWNILIKQAKIDATIQLIEMIFFIFVGFGLYKLHKSLSNENNSNNYEDNSVFGALMVTSFIIYVFVMVIFIFFIDNIINGYFNPEYWALHTLLNSLK